MVLTMDTFYEEFGARVRACRLKRQFTQETLAERVGLRRTSITNLEAGNQHVPLHVLVRLAQELEVSPADLLPDHLAADSGRADPVMQALEQSTTNPRHVKKAQRVLRDLRAERSTHESRNPDGKRDVAAPSNEPSSR